MSDASEQSDAENYEEITDELLGLLIDQNNDAETVAHQARLISAFYTKARNQIGVFETSDGDVHDPSLELTREWMTYTMGEL